MKLTMWGATLFLLGLMGTIYLSVKVGYESGYKAAQDEQVSACIFPELSEWLRENG